MVDGLDVHGLPLWPAAERNKQPILERLLQIVPRSGGVWLEIAAATGQHALHFAAHFTSYNYIPTDHDEKHLATLIKRRLMSQLANLGAPVRLDVVDSVWPIEEADVIYNANMVHIAPLAAAEGLFRGAGRVLKRGKLLLTYGPYKFDGVHTSESNERFDESLRARNPEWGVRDWSELRLMAEAAGLTCRDPIPMPANNFLLVWDKT